MSKMFEEVIDLLNDVAATKVLATCDSAGTLNVVPKGSIAALDEETVAFCDIMGDKTNANLEATHKAAIAVFKIDLPPVGYQIKGTFQGFHSSGPLFDKFSGLFSELIKQVLNLDIKAVGIIKVDEVYSLAPPNAGAKLV